ncbi:MAG: tetratricopeptide repeat protein [Phycisphaerae bacterium]|nr:tetratricopeptide repeat protein [Phycisphaerae bacterium]MDD5381020.1 tetratricopeptide repeat protein [Phycisphaerae bacterium]
MFTGKGDKTATTKNLWWIPTSIFCCALLVRLIFLAENFNDPFFNYRGIDARAYHWMAAGLLDGTWPGGKTFFWPPLYPLFLGLLYKTIGQNATIIKIVQAALGSLSCVLVYFIARIIFTGRFVPIAAALICCLCGTLVYFDVQLLPGNLDVLLELLIIFFLLFASRRRQIIWWGVAGVFIGLSAINRGTILLFLPIILLWMYMVLRGRWSIDGESERPAFWKAAIALLLPAGLIIFPVVLHNVRYDTAVVDKEPKPVSLKQFVSTGFFPIGWYLGINVYLGNHWELRKVNDIEHPDFFAIYKRIENEPAEKGIQNTFGRSRYLVRETLRHIFEKPTDFIKLMWLKVFQLFNGAEIPRNANIYAFRQHSVLLSVLLWKKIIAFPSGLIIPLGLVGIFLSRDLWRKHFLLLGCLLMQYLLLLIIFVTARYRLPTIPLLAIYAAFALDSFIRYIKDGAKRRAVVPVVLLVVLVLFCNSFTGKMEANHGYSEYINLGNTLRSEGKTHEAIFYYEEAMKLAPNFPEAYINLGNVFARKGEIDQAVIHYKKALQYDTDSFDAHYNLAIVLVERGKHSEAVKHYVTALKLKPGDAEVHFDLANILAGLGKFDEAIAHYKEALNFKPDYLEARNNLAKVLAERGRLAETIQH